MKLQIKDAGAWRNMVGFTITEQVDVMQAAAGLLKSLRQPRTELRVIEGEKALFFCRAPEFLWSPK